MENKAKIGRRSGELDLGATLGVSGQRCYIIAQRSHGTHLGVGSEEVQLGEHLGH